MATWSYAAGITDGESVAWTFGKVEADDELGAIGLAEAIVGQKYDGELPDGCWIGPVSVSAVTSAQDVMDHARSVMKGEKP